jgi:hypothetical protein
MNRSQGVLVGDGITIDRSPKEMVQRIGQIKLNRCSRIAIELVVESVDLILGVRILLHRYSRSHRGMAIEELLRISREGIQIGLHRFVATMDRSIERWILNINPILFSLMLMHLRGSMLRDAKRVGKALRLIKRIRSIWQSNAKIPIRLRYPTPAASRKSYEQKEQQTVFGYTLHKVKIIDNEK